MPSRAESKVGWRSRSKCMILLQRHREAGALMGADSPAPEVGVVPEAAEEPRDFISSCWVVGGASVSEGVWSEDAVVAALVCRSALTEREEQDVIKVL